MADKLTLDGIDYIPKYVERNCESCVINKEKCWKIEQCTTHEYKHWIMRPTLKQIVLKSK